MIYFLLLWMTAVVSGIELQIDARSAILMNAESGAILFEKQPHLRSFPASTTKIATALYVLDQTVDLHQIATVSGECLKGRPVKDRDLLPGYWLDSDGTMMGLKRGEKVPLEALLFGLMLVSGNDAANVIAEALGGSVPAFMEQMNAYLQGFGCKHTQLQNPHGLHHPEHYTTAYDMALITQKALQIPKFRQIVSTLVFSKPATNKQPAGEIRLTNALMKPKSRYYYPKALGIKTGYTDAALNTLVAAAEHEGRVLIAVIFGSQNRGQRYEDAKRLFEAAFAETKQRRRLIGPENIFHRPVEGAKTALKAALNHELSIEYYPSEEPQCKAALHWSYGDLPIRKGQKVGEVEIQDQRGKILQKGDLIALEEIKGSFLFNLKRIFAL